MILFCGEMFLANMHAVHGVILSLTDSAAHVGTFTRKPTTIAATPTFDNSVTDMLAPIAFKVPVAREAELAGTGLLRQVAESQIQKPSAGRDPSFA